MLAAAVAVAWMFSWVATLEFWRKSWTWKCVFGTMVAAAIPFVGAKHADDPQGNGSSRTSMQMVRAVTGETDNDEENHFSITSFQVDAVNREVTFGLSWADGLFDDLGDYSVDVFMSTNLRSSAWLPLTQIYAPWDTNEVVETIGEWDVDYAFHDVFTNAFSNMAFFLFGLPVDSDGDNLTDAYEMHVLGTSPEKSDTDGDQVDDHTEVQNGSNPADASDFGIAPPANRTRPVTFNIDGDWAAWELTVEGMGPDDFRVMRVSMGRPDRDTYATNTLHKGNAYRLSMRWLNCAGHEDNSEQPWYCWQVRIDGQPWGYTFDDHSSSRNAGVAEIVGGDGWIADNRSGLLTVQVHENIKNGGNVAAAAVTNHSITNRPAFNISDAEEMMDRTATEDDVSLALAKHVPALSSPVGGNVITVGNRIENHDLNGQDDYRSGWGRDHPTFEDSWLHSDMKDMAHCYVSKLYDQLVQKGCLK